MKFNCCIDGSSTYSEQTDEDFCDEVTFEFEADDDEVEDAVIDILFDNEFKKYNFDKEQTRKIKEALKQTLCNYDLIDDVEVGLKDDLAEVFREQAMDSYLG